MYVGRENKFRFGKSVEKVRCIWGLEKVENPLWIYEPCRVLVPSLKEILKRVFEAFLLSTLVCEVLIESLVR